MIPHLLVKCKEIVMNIQESLLDLEESAQKISDGVMVLGLDGAGSQYTGALYAIWQYLSDAESDFRKCLKACLEAG